MFSLESTAIDSEIQTIVSKVRDNNPLSATEGLMLYDRAPLFLLSELATERKKISSGNNVFYNKNFHIEPTNICYYNCKFCSYRKGAADAQAWNMSVDEIAQYVLDHKKEGITEVHLVGGVHPNHTLEHYCNIIKTVAELMPEAKIKAFSAIEHIYAIEKEGISYTDGLKQLIKAGLSTITGGGAEIFDQDIRSLICPDKPSSEKWLAFHEAAHRLSIQTNATMLYGHIEKPINRINHMIRLRTLQESTAGFNAFIPLKFRSKNNSMSHLGECSIIDDLKTLALSRIMLNNVPHIKAYWPMYGKQTTQMALLFGADDIDGTVDYTTKIYSMAGATENSMTEEELKILISDAGYTPAERDTFYNAI